MDVKCSICLDNIDNNYVLTKCNHYFHLECYIQNLKYRNTCPNCRNNIKTLVVKYMVKNTKLSLIYNNKLDLIGSIPIWIFN